MNPEAAQNRLHYNTPATTWSQALPVGNGRLGCMVHGRVTTELLQLNEDSVWYGGPQDRTPRSAIHLPKLRQLIRQGKHSEAEKLAREHFFSSPVSMRHYEPLGSAYLEFDAAENGEVANYRRWLDIDNSICSVEYQLDGVQVRRDVIASYPDDVLIVHITASQSIRFNVRLSRRSEHEWDTNEFFDSLRVIGSDDELGGAGIVMSATPGGRDSNRMCCVLSVRCSPDSGFVDAVGTCLTVNTTDCLLVIGAQTTYRHADPKTAASLNVFNALQKTWQGLLSEHMSDYQRLYKQTSLCLEPNDHHKPTDVRLAERDAKDAGLVALYHNYGRYLLISSSRDGPKAIPANLQGIWNPSFSPPWGSKFTININIQMNYWPAMSCNLDQCVLPLVDLLERMAQRGRKTAQFVYGCSGWCCHHNTDIWADTDPQDTWMPATLWPLGGLWLCIDAVQMLQFHYDKPLHLRLFPILKGCIEFLRDFLVPSEDERYLVTNPSLSPENTFVTDAGEMGKFCEGSAIDMTIVKMALRLYLWSVKILEYSDPLEQEVERMLARIPELKINRDGLIQEWGLKDYKESEPGHRHVSHLFGLYPANSISMSKSPELVSAAKRVLERRLAHGGGHTGWSRAWLLNMYARLRDGEACGNHMELLLTKSTLPNLLDNHPPFQIDGNFGGCAGILECLIQSTEVEEQPKHTSHGVIIQLLPACPKQWAKGKLSGVCVRGGWRVTFEWDGGSIIDPVHLLGASDGQGIRWVKLVYPDGESINVEGFGEHEVSRNRRSTSTI